MTEKFSDIYYPEMAPEKLADNVLKKAYSDEIPSIPIDPFNLMKKFGIVYQFMEFEELEGIYIVPENEEDVPIVGISYKRKITRQRFTAAHEYASDGRVTLDDALQIAERFGVSFRSCVLRLAYTFHLLDGEYADLNKRITQYKPDIAKRRLGMDLENIELLKQVVDSYPFFFQIRESIVWYRFKNDFIYNENRMEGLNLNEEEVAEIITDLRMNRQESDYCEEDYEDIIQVAGHSDLYDYVLETADKLTIYKLLDLNRMLFQYAPFPEEAGKTRTDNNLVLGTKFETVDWRDVANELIKL